MEIVGRKQLRDAADAKTSGTAAETANSNSGKPIKHFVISFSRTRRKTRLRVKKFHRWRKRSIIRSRGHSSKILLISEC